MLKQKGFSLIELLVVMVIIGIVLSFVLLAFGDFGSSRRIMMGQQHLADLIKLARVRAIIEAKTYGLHITPKKYAFYQFYHKTDSPYGKWYILNSSIFKSTPLPQDVKMNYNHAIQKSNPEILISSDGHITPFKLILTTNDKDRIELKVTFNGEVKLTQEEPS